MIDYKENDLISVVIPTYKRAKYLKRAIDSVLNQSYTNVEIIVVDDNNSESDDRKATEKIMSFYKDDYRIKYIKHEKNKNGAAARNTGIANSMGTYICFLDDDDWYLKNKIKIQYEYLLENPEFDAVYCGYEREKVKDKPSKTGDLSFELLSGVSLIYTNTIMIKRESVIEFGGWDERFRRNQEAVFLLRYFANGGKIGAIPEILVQFDVSDDRNRSDPKQNEKDYQFYLEIHEKEIQKCEKRFYDAKAMIYSWRFRGVLLNYIKYGCIKDAIILYKKMNKMLPKRFSKDCVYYLKARILKQHLFAEYEKYYQKF